jgi:hypothetical protein
LRAFCRTETSRPIDANQDCSCAANLQAWLAGVFVAVTAFAAMGPVNIRVLAATQAGSAVSTTPDQGAR